MLGHDEMHHNLHDNPWRDEKSKIDVLKDMTLVSVREIWDEKEPQVSEHSVTGSDSSSQKSDIDDTFVDRIYNVLSTKVFALPDRDNARNELKEEVIKNLSDKKRTDLYSRRMQKLINIYEQEEKKQGSELSNYPGKMRLKKYATKIHKREADRLEYIQIKREEKGLIEGKIYYNISSEAQKLKRSTDTLHSAIRDKANKIYTENIKVINGLADTYGISKSESLDAIAYSLHFTDRQAQMNEFFQRSHQTNYPLDMARAVAGLPPKPNISGKFVDTVLNENMAPFKTNTDAIPDKDLLKKINRKAEEASGTYIDTSVASEPQVNEQKLNRYQHFLEKKVFHFNREDDEGKASLRAELAQNLIENPIYEARIKKLMHLYKETGDMDDNTTSYEKKSHDVITKQRLKEYLVKAHSGKEAERLTYKQLKREEKSDKSKIGGAWYYHVASGSEAGDLKSEEKSIENMINKNANNIFTIYRKTIETFVQESLDRGERISKQAVFDTLVYGMHSARLRAQAEALVEKSQTTTKEDVYHFIRDAIELTSKSVQGQWASVVAYGGLGQLRGPFPS
jgi:hypothetical protein